MSREKLMTTYGPVPVTFVRGDGTRLYDDAGKEYLDCNFRALGKRFAQQTPKVAAAIAAADASSLAAALASGRASVEVEGETVEVLPDEVIVSEHPREGWAVVNEHGETVALDLTITPELRRAGLAREMIRAIQEHRKSSGLEVSDRIVLTWSARGETAEAFTSHRDLIAAEVLATTTTPAADVDGLDGFLDDLGFAFSVAKA